MRRFADVASAVAWRSLYSYVTNPAILVPSLIFPLFFIVAFAGGLSNVGNVPGFDYPAGYTAFQFGFVLMQAAAFGGVFNGFNIAADFESGFARRLLLAALNRLAILAGYVLSALARSLLISALLFVVSLLAGMELLGSVGEILGLIPIVLAVSLAATSFAAGVAMRMRTIQAGPVMQTPVFIVLFLTPVFVPRDLLVGWVKAVSNVNPFTAIIEASRALIAGTDVHAWLAVGVLAGLIAVFLSFGVRGLRNAEAAGG